MDLAPSGYTDDGMPYAKVDHGLFGLKNLIVHWLPGAGFCGGVCRVMGRYEFKPGKHGVGWVDALRFIGDLVKRKYGLASHIQGWPKAGNNVHMAYYWEKNPPRRGWLKRTVAANLPSDIECIEVLAMGRVVTVRYDFSNYALGLCRGVSERLGRRLLGRTPDARIETHTGC